MTAVVVLLILVGIQAVAIALLLVERRRLGRAEQALRESERRLHDVLDRSPAMVWSARPDVSLDYLNRTCSEFTGLPVERLRAEGWLDALHSDDLDHVNRVIESAVAARAPILTEYRLRRADGAYRWMMATGLPRLAPDGGFLGWVGCDVDITERREAEDRLRESSAALEASHEEIQHLAGRLIEAQDAERARVARELHDDVSQQLAGLSIALSGLKRRMEELRVREDLKADVRGIHQRTATLVQNIRHLSHDLHPTVLRHAGLVAALTSHCAELERSHGLVVTCSAEGDFASLDAEPAICLYRIAQEALRNAIAHAGGSRADVRLRHTGEQAEITISDDGKGFDFSSSIERGKGLGLVSIVERARLAGGTFGVASSANQGTTVRVQVPAHVPRRTTGTPREHAAS